MQIVYAQSELPAQITKTIFLAGPTPRDPNAEGWRSEALAILNDARFFNLVTSNKVVRFLAYLVLCSNERMSLSDLDDLLKDSFVSEFVDFLHDRKNSLKKQSLEEITGYNNLPDV
jgi:hypothetical protein